MKSEASQNLKNKKTRSNLDCPCMKFFLSKWCTKVFTKSDNVKYNTVNTDTTKSSNLYKPKNTRNSRIIRLPKIRCSIPYLTALLNDLSNTKAVRMDADEITNAANSIFEVKADVDSGKVWNGKIQIAENLHLKLYKSGLVLHHKL